MRLLYFTLFVTTSFILNSCLSNNHETDFADFPEYNEISTANVVQLPSILIFPNSIRVSDTLLFILDIKDVSGFLKIYSKKDFHLIKTFGEIGKGPNEFLNPHLSYVNTKKNVIFLSDVAGKKLYKIDLKKLIFSKVTTLSDYSISYKEYYQLFSSFALSSDGKFYASGPKGYDRFVLWDSAFNISNLGGKPLEDWDLEEPIRSLFYFNFLVYDSINHSIFCAYLNKDRICKFDINSKKTFEIFGKKHKDKRPESIGLNGLNQDYRAFGDLKIWETNLIAPYLGDNQIYYKNDGYEFVWPQKLLVFDLNLNPKVILKLNHQILSMDIDESGLLYILTPDEENKLYIYNLKKYL
ncbi:BF3164 family lipoprotein [Tenuifilum thalassicum]|uniref:6-bladed beta-propeller n=1 Tax=Tenuifilum thalassicum TaxID=2590900 RepID=A0A7D3Y348_9BACT|nr:BF3164 family lipoprotein [Tenuifilum thalassicum]QKG79189.1 hypothetical protein FHG85_02560 [Tenuifilum thalassicum]